jgi:DNA polymerase III subunit delta'
MTLRPIYGHEALLDRLAGALASGRFPQASLLVGPPGVGKQRVALWIGQALLCEQGPGVPCGTCIPCRQALNLQHPDLHWFVPIPRPKAGDADKMVDEARELLGQVMEERRKEPFWGRPDGMASHSVASVRLLHRLAWLTPFSGDRKVFVVGDAERLVVQESSPDAANALLKVLEEPPRDTTVILTAADPNRLLPTVRSRLVTLRVPPVADDAVRTFLRDEVEPAPTGKVLERQVQLAEGSIGRAISADDTAEPDQKARRFLQSVRKGRERWLQTAFTQAPWSARGEFTAMLDALALQLRDELGRVAADPDPAKAEGHIAALRRVEAARAGAQGNANPQLTLANLAEELEHLV